MDDDAPTNVSADSDDPGAIPYYYGNLTNLQQIAKSNRTQLGVITGSTDCYRIGISKTVIGVPAALPDGSYDVVYKMRVKNLSNYVITNLMVTDNLTATFSTRLPAASIIGVTSSPTVSSPAPNVNGVSSGIAANNTFNGTSDTALVKASSSSRLDKGDHFDIQFTVRIKPNGGNYGPFNNSAFIYATDLDGGRGHLDPIVANRVLVDVSNDLSASQAGDLSSAIDPDSNGDPTQLSNSLGKDENTPTSLVLGAVSIGSLSTTGNPSLRAMGSALLIIGASVSLVLLTRPRRRPGATGSPN